MISAYVHFDEVNTTYALCFCSREAEDKKRADISASASSLQQERGFEDFHKDLAIAERYLGVMWGQIKRQKEGK